MDLLLSIYMAATIFGIGVTIIDLAGIFAGHGFEHSDHADHADITTDSAGDDADDHGSHDTTPSVVLHDRNNPETGRGKIVYRVIQAIRGTIYFSLGFGPVGWFALATGLSPLSSLLWSVPVGTAAFAGTRALRRLFMKTLDSQVTDAQLLSESGEVVVSIHPDSLGKVRINLGISYVERYARAKNPEDDLPAGTAITVVDLGDECIYVERR